MRKTITIGLGLRLWEEHNRRVLKYIESTPTRFVYYGDLLNQDRWRLGLHS